jgi:hypothetical protein
LPRTKKDGSKEEGTRAALDAPAASLGSENCRVKSAVEMTPRGKRGKLKNPKASFPLFPPGLEIRPKQRRRIATFPPRRRRLYILRKDQKTKPKTNSSWLIAVSSRTTRKPASLRSDRDGYYASEIPIKHPIGIRTVETIREIFWR